MNVDGIYIQNDWHLVSDINHCLVGNLNTVESVILSTITKEIFTRCLIIIVLQNA